MSISAVSSPSFQSQISTASINKQKAAEGTTGSMSASGDTYEMSSAAKSGGSSACPKGNSTCIGCGSCGKTVSSSTRQSLFGDSQSADFTVLSALKAYDSQTKYL